jgi:hypothetical protein
MEISSQDTIDLEESTSTLQCLEICAWILVPSFALDEQVSADFLKNQKTGLASTIDELDDHLKDIERQLGDHENLGDKISERERLQKEKDNIKKCCAICYEIYYRMDRVQRNTSKPISQAHQVKVA